MLNLIQNADRLSNEKQSDVNIKFVYFFKQSTEIYQKIVL
jgi:hypothetical protein